MGDFGVQSQDYNRVVISTITPEALAGEVVAMNATVQTSTAWPAANRAIFVPFLVYSPLIVARLFLQNGSAISGNVDVGVYDTSGNRLSSAGSTAQAGTSGAQFFDVADFTLLPGTYYLAAAVDNTTATATVGSGATLAAVSGMGVLSQSSAFPLPNPATFGAAQDNYIPNVGLSGRTV